MFREIERDPVFEETERTLWVDTRLQDMAIPPKYLEYLPIAAQIKAQYEFELVGILRRYSISEPECIVGLPLRSPDTRLRVEKDYDLRIALREAYKDLVDAVQEQVLQYLKDNSFSREQDRRMWALVTYKMTYDPQYQQEVDWSSIDAKLGLPEEEGDDDETPEARSCWSFPWLFSKHLCAQV